MRSSKPTRHKYALGVALVLASAVGCVRAEISLDNEFPWRKQDVGFALAGVSYFEAAINRDQMANGFEPKSYETINFFRMLWNGHTFYVAGTQYVSKEEMASIRRGIAEKKDRSPVPGGGICTLFIYDENLKQAAKHDVLFAEADGKTWCNGANALARVRGQDALLFSVSYYLTDKPLAKQASEIGDGWRYMTVLLRLQEKNGKVVIQQDDSCLRNPNAYKDVASARKALAACVPR